MIQEIQTEAIVLSSIPFKEKDLILTLFTKKLGLISLFVKNKNKKQALSPLSNVEIICKKAKKDFYFLLDFSLNNPHINLRDNLESILTASKMIKAIMKSQLPEQQEINLFLLLKAYLNQLATSSNHEALLSSFHLKILSHMGLIHLEENKLQASVESYIETKDMEIVKNLISTRNFSDLEKQNSPNRLSAQINKLFFSLI